MLKLENSQEIKPISNDFRKSFLDNGYVILENFIPENLCDDYWIQRLEEYDNGVHCHKEMAYLEKDYIRNIGTYEPLLKVLDQILDGQVGLHLNLTNVRSTERMWHQDDYLNPDYIQGRYVAVWVAVNDIHPDSGPFQYVPKSNNWGRLTRSQIQKEYPLEFIRGDWTITTQERVAEFYENEIEKRNEKVVSFLGKKGDVLIWHGWLIHRGSKPVNPNIFRPSLILHYTEKEAGIEYSWKGRVHSPY
jgi:ectoine hydroxylase-related dioxygenase (phytanoyl-CoA dioxygenase family)